MPRVLNLKFFDPVVTKERRGGGSNPIDPILSAMITLKKKSFFQALLKSLITRSTPYESTLDSI